MRFALTDEQAAMAEAVRDLLTSQCPPETVRAAWDDDGATARALLARLGETGVLAMLVPEESGGLGLDAATMAPVLEQVGYAAAPGPVADVVAAAPLLTAAGHPRAEAALAGQAVVASGLGRADAVPHAQLADVVLLETAEGPRAFDRDAVELTPLDSVDGARRLARVVPTGDGTPLAGPYDARVATLATAAELVGLAQRMLDLTVDYVTQREQFGKPVGSFQAIKHQLADALKAVAFARPAVRRAGATLAGEEASASRDVATAKAVASDAAEFVAGKAIQCHGAIGYTVEYDLHLYAKRAWALRADRGDAAAHRAAVADELGIPAPAGA